MAGRITLLMLMTGLFAAAWSSDHPPATATPATTPPPPYSVESVRETALHRWRVTNSESLASRSRDSLRDSARKRLVGIVRELPAGTYLVVNSPEGVSHVEILEMQALSDPAAAPLNWVDLGKQVQAEFSAWKSQRRRELIWRQILLSIRKAGRERSELPVASEPADSSQR